MAAGLWLVLSCETWLGSGESSQGTSGETAQGIGLDADLMVLFSLSCWLIISAVIGVPSVLKCLFANRR